MNSQVTELAKGEGGNLLHQKCERKPPSRLDFEQVIIFFGLQGYTIF